MGFEGCEEEGEREVSSRSTRERRWERTEDGPGDEEQDRMGGTMPEDELFDVILEGEEPADLQDRESRRREGGAGGG